MKKMCIKVGGWNSGGIVKEGPDFGDICIITGIFPGQLNPEQTFYEIKDFIRFQYASTFFIDPVEEDVPAERQLEKMSY